MLYLVNIKFLLSTCKWTKVTVCTNASHVNASRCLVLYHFSSARKCGLRMLCLPDSCKRRLRLCLYYIEPLSVSTWKTFRHSMNRNGQELKQVVHKGYSWKCVAISSTFSIVYGCLIYCGPSSLEIAVVTRLTTFKTVDLPMPKALATFLTRRSSVR